MTRIVVMVAGAIAMVIGASSTMWWSISPNESLGLRGATSCAGNGCTSLAYRDDTFATLGSIAFYAAFVTAAIALIAVVARWRNLAIARRAIFIAMIVGIAALGVAIVFIVTRPESLDFAQEPYIRMRIFTHALSIGWALVAYIAGALVLIAGGVSSARAR